MKKRKYLKTALHSNPTANKQEDIEGKGETATKLSHKVEENVKLFSLFFSSKSRVCCSHLSCYKFVISGVQPTLLSSTLSLRGTITHCRTGTGTRVFHQQFLNTLCYSLIAIDENCKKTILRKYEFSQTLFPFGLELFKSNVSQRHVLLFKHPLITMNSTLAWTCTGIRVGRLLLIYKRKVMFLPYFRVSFFE